MIDQTAEETLRKLISHAIHGRHGELEQTVASAGETTNKQATTLAIRVTGYVLIRSAKRWPLDADFKSAARIVSETLTTTPVVADEIHAYLRDVVFGSGNFGGHPLTPLYTLAGLLAGLKTPQGSDWNDHLDLAEAGIDAAEATREEADPAIVYRYLKKSSQPTLKRTS